MSRSHRKTIVSVRSPFQLKRWRHSRDWSVRRAAMWAGVSVFTWHRYEAGVSRIPHGLRYRISELNHQQRVFQYARNQLLALDALIATDKAKQIIDALLPLFESATPDPKYLRGLRRARDLPDVLLDALAAALDARLESLGPPGADQIKRGQEV
jgi:hypothetical protein